MEKVNPVHKQKKPKCHFKRVNHYRGTERGIIETAQRNDIYGKISRIESKKAAKKALTI
jgi:hypothetical protein